MKAIVQDKYGEPQAVLTVREVAKPVIKGGEVLGRRRLRSRQLESPQQKGVDCHEEARA